MRTVVVSLGLLAVLPLVGGGQPPKAQPPKKGPAPVTEAIAVLHPTSKGKAQGVIRFSQKGDGVEITGEITGLTPGKHGFHVHEYGDCSAPDASSAGGHFNPTNMPHGAPDDPRHHVGDLGNIEANEAGKATVRMTAKGMRLTGPNGIIGHALIVHAKADDLKSQPSGDAGDRVACAVIGIANPQKTPAK